MYPSSLQSYSEMGNIKAPISLKVIILQNH